ncbi:hypothetical protein KKB44_04140 [Candidatus Micrarchaeota archaeon]|nr:hypothetical protein [Candidatus Micrarchaeota archaeon]
MLSRNFLILFLIASTFLISGCFLFPDSSSNQSTSQNNTVTATVVDIRLPSSSTGDGALAVRIHFPNNTRYDGGAPVVIWVPGGYDGGGINHELAPELDDTIIITLLFPGTKDNWSGLSSDGIYDYRGENSILAIKDVILYAAGEKTDSLGRTIDDVANVSVLHDDIGLIGVSNGGNIIIAVPAFYGNELNGHLRYVIQWETPVSSQIANRDFGRIWLKPATGQGDYFNPRYSAYGPLVLGSNYSDLTYNPNYQYYTVFHDGNGDDQYTTVQIAGKDIPDLNGNGKLELDEDFPLDYYPGGDNGSILFYSRPVTYAMESMNIFNGSWPSHFATPEQADEYWDMRESVVLYDDAIANMPDLEVMILTGEVDHVQSSYDKFNIRQAFDGLIKANVSWVQINPSRNYLVSINPLYSSRNDLPNNEPYKPPTNWKDFSSYTIPGDIFKGFYQSAAVWQMADRAYNGK